MPLRVISILGAGQTHTHVHVHARIEQGAFLPVEKAFPRARLDEGETKPSVIGRAGEREREYIG